MSPEGSGSPSNTVTMPTISSIVPSFPVAFGSIRTKSSCSGRKPNASGVSVSFLPARDRSSGDTGSP